MTLYRETLKVTETVSECLLVDNVINAVYVIFFINTDYLKILIASKGH